MYSDEKAADEFRKHILGCVQIFVFALAICMLAIVIYT